MASNLTTEVERIFMDYLDVVIELTYYGIQKETRLSERQVRQLRWDQITGDTIHTAYKREAHISEPLVKALGLLPSHGERYVFPIWASPADASKMDRQKMVKALRQNIRDSKRSSRSRLKLSFVRG